MVEPDPEVVYVPAYVRRIGLAMGPLQICAPDFADFDPNSSQGKELRAVSSPSGRLTWLEKYGSGSIAGQGCEYICE